MKHSLWGSQRNPPLKLDLWEPCKRLCVRAGLASCIFSSKIIFLFLFMNGVIFLSVGMINRRGNTLSLNLQKEWPEYLLRGRERGPSLFAPFCAACSPPWGMVFLPGQEFLAPPNLLAHRPSLGGLACFPGTLIILYFWYQCALGSPRLQRAIMDRRKLGWGCLVETHLDAWCLESKRQDEPCSLGMRGAGLLDQETS